MLEPIFRSNNSITGFHFANRPNRCRFIFDADTRSKYARLLVRYSIVILSISFGEIIKRLCHVITIFVQRVELFLTVSQKIRQALHFQPNQWNIHTYSVNCHHGTAVIYIQCTQRLVSVDFCDDKRCVTKLDEPHVFQHILEQIAVCRICHRQSHKYS